MIPRNRQAGRAGSAKYRADPDRPLSEELGVVLDAGYLRGADAWHVACALFLARVPGSMSFLTLDEAQGSVAGALGFEIPSR